MVVDQLLDEVVASEVKVNKLFTATKEEFTVLSTKAKHHIKELISYADKLRL